MNARRVLARIYTQQIGDAQANHVDEGMTRKAIEQFKIISERDPKDLDSLVMLGRLDRVLENSVDAEAAFKKVLSVDPDNEDATTGLARVYADRNDPRSASALLEKLTKKSPSAKAYVNLASSYESMHEYGLAADAYKNNSTKRARQLIKLRHSNPTTLKFSSQRLVCLKRKARQPKQSRP